MLTLAELPDEGLCSGQLAGASSHFVADSSDHVATGPQVAVFAKGLGELFKRT
jgi:hypothetical protein